MPPRTWGWYSIRPPPDSGCRYQALMPGASMGGAEAAAAGAGPVAASGAGAGAAAVAPGAACVSRRMWSRVMGPAR